MQILTDDGHFGRFDDRMEVGFVGGHFAPERGRRVEIDRVQGHADAVRLALLSATERDKKRSAEPQLTKMAEPLDIFNGTWQKRAALAESWRGSEMSRGRFNEVNIFRWAASLEIH